MTITLQLSPDQERLLRAGAVRQDAAAVREILLQAVDSTVEEILRTAVRQPKTGNLSSLLDKIAADLRDAPALSDEALTRSGIYSEG
jgi:hypothetical protein